MANILIVDDEAYIREFLSEELASEGYQVASASDAESMWGHLRDSQPDLVLLDLYLKGFKGWEVLSDIKNKDSNLPVLIVTAYDTYEEDTRLSQADGYVIKNFEALGKLKQMIADILYRKSHDHKGIRPEVEERALSPPSQPTRLNEDPLFKKDETDFNKIREMAKGMGVNPQGMEKTDVILAIQRAENNVECYGTQRVDSCHEDACLWRKDCRSLTHNGNSEQ